MFEPKGSNLMLAVIKNVEFHRPTILHLMSHSVALDCGATRKRQKKTEKETEILGSSKEKERNTDN